MKQSEIKELSTDEIGEKIENEQANLAKIKMTHAISPLENPLKVRHSRRTVARLKTELTKRIKIDSEKK